MAKPLFIGTKQPMTTTISGLTQAINSQEGLVKCTVKLIFYTAGRNKPEDPTVEINSDDTGVTVDTDTMIYVLDTDGMLPGQLAAFAHVTYPLSDADDNPTDQPITEKLEVKLDTTYILTNPPILSEDERESRTRNDEETEVED